MNPDESDMSNHPNQSATGLPGSDDGISSTTYTGALDSRTIVEMIGESKSSQPRQDHTPGSFIGKYEIRSLLGKGGMGVVYAAFDPLIEREVALKLLSRDLLGTPMALQRFLGEAKAIGRLNHPNVVSIFDIGVWEDQHFLIMELLPGGCVADKVDGGQPLPWREACRIVAEAAMGLDAAHQEGMVHRDIKPENLMLSKNGVVKVVDFGLSKLLDANQESQLAVTKAGQIMGTPHYMSPEQLKGNPVDAGTDIYSLGATLFRLLTGRYPFHDATTIFAVLSAHMNQPVPKASNYISGLPPDCDQIIARSMAKDRSERFESIAEIAAELNRLIYQDESTVALANPAATVEYVANSTQRKPIPQKPLLRAVIVEPSKLQGVIIRNSLMQWGITQVASVVSKTEAMLAFEANEVDLLITAQQLDEGLGLELIRESFALRDLREVAAVLNSSDVSLRELAGVRGQGHVVLAPKKSHVEDVLLLVHALSSRFLTSAATTNSIDTSALKLAIFTATGRIPQGLQNLVRESQILEVDVQNSRDDFEEATADLKVLYMGSKSPIEVAILQLDQLKGQDGTTVIVFEAEGHLHLAGAARRGIVYLGESELDDARFLRLVQSCRP